jgi:glycosyltransferase involved in cell wall biosynthesis
MEAEGELHGGRAGHYAAPVPTYAVLIPVYNERELFPRLLERLLATAPVAGADGAALERRIVVVDDGSTDGTSDLVRSLHGRPGFLAVVQDRNRGKGAAVRRAFEEALGAGADLFIIQDADLEYDPAEHARVLAPILDGRADAVFGTRFLGDTHRVLYFWHSVANRVISTLSNMMTNLNLTDIECCFKAFTREVAQRIAIKEDRFGLEPELVAKVARMRLSNGAGTRRARVYEVGVSYAGRTYEEGKKITWKDGVSALRCIVKYRFF